MAIKQQLTCAGTDLPTDQAQDCGLAPPRHAHQGRDLATRHVEAEVLQNDTVAVPESQVAQFNKWRGGGCGVHEKQEPEVPALVVLEALGWTGAHQDNQGILPRTNVLQRGKSL
jgi:hypothetical protein